MLADGLGIMLVIKVRNEAGLLGNIFLVSLLITVFLATICNLSFAGVDDFPVLAGMARKFVPHDDGAANAHLTNHLKG